LQVRHFLLQIGEAVDAGDIVELRRQRTYADTLDELLVHAARVEVTDLLLGAAVRRMCVGGVLDQLAGDLLVVHLEDVGGAPGGVGGGNGFALLPAAVGVLEEALRGARMLVEPALVQGVVRLRTGGERGSRQTYQNPKKRETMESHMSPSVVSTSRCSA